MTRLLDVLSHLVTARPVITLVLLLVVTVALGAGFTRLAPQAPNTVFLPEGSAVATASNEIEVVFGDPTPTVTATMLFRGESLTPEGLTQIAAAVGEVEAHSGIAPLLAAPVVSPVGPLTAALGTTDFASVTQAEIEAAVTGNPALARLVGVDEDGTRVAVAYVRLHKLGDEERLESAELAVRDIAQGSRGSLEGSSLSPATVSEETSQALGPQMIQLMIIALFVIAVLLFVFTRSLVDLVLSLLGLVLTIVWVVGAQGWLGPNGVGLIGAPNTLTTMVPIMLIGLVVDYAIQTVALYREQRNEGQPVRPAVRIGLRSVMIPLTLAAVTTVVSFLTNLTSPIPANGDFGVVAGIGVAFGLLVMLTLLASFRALLDRWRERRGSLGLPRPVSGAIPGVGPAVEALGGQLALRPAPFLLVIAVITILLGIAARDIETVFDTRDFLPLGGEAIRNIKTLDAVFGGAADNVNVLIRAELTDDRTIRNLIDFTEAFSDDLRRPEGVVGGIQSSLGILFIDWITGDGSDGDKFDQDLQDMALAANNFRLAPAEMQALIDRLEELDPEGFALVAVDDPAGDDILLMKFQALSGDQARTERMVADVEGLWFGNDEEMTPTSGEIVGLEVVGAMTDSQTSSILATVMAALIILVIFFWITEGRPALGFIAVGPIVLVLIWVLGTMTLAGIPYNVITALITALSIGIGVDYTIHIIHRYEEEFAHSRDPEAAARRTLGTTGSALLGSALTTALGFGVLIFSSLTPFQQFGIVTAITIAYALIAAVVVVPPAMILWAAYQNYRLRSAVARAERELPFGEPSGDGSERTAIRLPDIRDVLPETSPDTAAFRFLWIRFDTHPFRVNSLDDSEIDGVYGMVGHRNQPAMDIKRSHIGRWLTRSEGQKFQSEDGERLRVVVQEHADGGRPGLYQIQFDLEDVAEHSDG